MSEPAWGPPMGEENPNQEPRARGKGPYFHSRPPPPPFLVLWMKVGVRWVSLGGSGLESNTRLLQLLEQVGFTPSYSEISILKNLES